MKRRQRALKLSIGPEIFVLVEAFAHPARGAPRGPRVARSHRLGRGLGTARLRPPPGGSARKADTKGEVSRGLRDSNLISGREYGMGRRSAFIVSGNAGNRAPPGAAGGK